MEPKIKSIEIKLINGDEYYFDSIDLKFYVWDQAYAITFTENNRNKVIRFPVVNVLSSVITEDEL